MKLGFIKPNYPNEKRVALLPEHINNLETEIYIEKGFGEFFNIDDKEYIQKGCKILARETLFKECQNIFSLKLIQPSDYDLLSRNHTIIGWTHPNGSGRKFMEEQAIPKDLKIVDLDNIYPRVYYKKKSFEIPFLKKNFIWKNSFMSGISATNHALLAFGLIPDQQTKVAILSSGSVSQGAFNSISKYSAEVRMFYRKTMDEFKESIDQYDIIINGIEVDVPGLHIISMDDLKRTKKNCLIIDAAADAGNAIEGTRFTYIDNPIYKENDRFFYLVNNAPSIYYKTSSVYISESFSKNIYKKDQLSKILAV